MKQHIWYNAIFAKYQFLKIRTKIILYIILFIFLWNKIYNYI